MSPRRHRVCCRREHAIDVILELYSVIPVGPCLIILLISTRYRGRQKENLHKFTGGIDNLLVLRYGNRRPKYICYVRRAFAWRIRPYILPIFR